MLPLFISDVPLHCINEAAMKYKVPARLIISVLNVERGKVGQAVRNKNGSYDSGPMQINTSWWPKLYNFGITPQKVQYNPCVNVKIGTWILSKSIVNGRDLLSGIGNYNSHTPAYNHTYVHQVRIYYTQLTRILMA